MSLKARIRALEVKVEWLEQWGELRQVNQTLKQWQATRQIVDHLSANPTVAARFGVGDMIRARPGRPGADTLIEALVAARAAVPSTTGPPEPPPKKPSPEKPPPEEPPPEPPPLASPPKTEAWTHDPPEHMQIEKVTWRRRSPQDDLEDEQAEEDGYYDAFRDV